MRFIDQTALVDICKEKKITESVIEGHLAIMTATVRKKSLENKQPLPLRSLWMM